jgi:hypothetical protein
MSSILYYSNFCDHSKKLLQAITKTSLIDDLHFICIDKRIREKDGKIYIILENGQKLIMPENVDRVPALLLLSNFNVLYGEDIYNFVKPKQTQMTSQATMNNMEPIAYCLGGGYGGIVSDNFSFLDMDSESLKAKGDGGLRQLHNYVSLNNEEQVNIYTPSEDKTPKSQKIQEGLTIEQLQQQRDQDIASMKTQPRQYI